MFQTIQHFTESSLEVPNLIQLFSHYTCLKLLKARSRDDSFSKSIQIWNVLSTGW